MKLERVLLDVTALPNPTDEVALGDKFPARLDQKLEDLEGAAAERNRFALHPHFAAGKIDLTAT
jgi:hypothetical protein